MPGSILGVRFRMIMYPSLPGTIGLFLCRLSQQTNLAFVLNFSFLKKVMILSKYLQMSLMGLYKAQSTPAMNSYSLY